MVALHTLHPDRKIAGILAPLFALRGTHDLGVGDVGALRQFVDWAAAHGFRLVQILPINETGEENSPYNAISSTALEPSTLETRPRAIPELTETDYAEVVAGFDLAAMSAGDVDYAAVKRLKLALLDRAFARFEGAGPARQRRHAAFLRHHAGWLPGYTLFRVLMEREGHEQWDLWPEGVRTLASAERWLAGLTPADREAVERRRRFFAYVQETAFRQWRALHDHCSRKGVALMGDVPIGINYYSCDVFSRPDQFLLDWSGGAPPEKAFKTDPFTEKWGQNWGVPPYDWAAMARDGYAWWRQRVRVAREVFHLFRIDHILGFYRMYCFPWRPQRNEEFAPLTEAQAAAKTGGHLPGFRPRADDTPADRAANRADGEAVLRVLLEESGPFRLIGEDLGVVPDYVRPSLTSLGIAGFKIPQWEPGPGHRLLPGADYPALSLTTYATHDHEPLRTVWERWVGALEAADRGEVARFDEANRARWEMQLLLDFAGSGWRANPFPWAENLHLHLLRGLFSAQSWMAVVMITDLFGTTDRFNVPGSISSTNWSHRLDGTPARWRRMPDRTALMAKIAQLLVDSGRV